MSMKKVIEIARGDIGEKEWPAGSNRTVFGERFGMNGQPWCVIWLWDVFQRAGERMAFFGGDKTASCTILLRWYKEQGLTVPVEDVQTGDIVLLNFHGGKDPEHCGLVTGRSDITDLSTGIPYSIWTIEGNTSASDGSQSNGGMVCEKIRYPRYIVAVCRPQYKPEEIADDWSGHHAADAIRWGKEIGLVKGYPDGTMRPDEPLPLWRMLTILKRYDDYRFGGSGK